ncbi:hypothetical protein [Salipiger mucosus]|uniref:Uncharacterized protein n=1 Tax=Salipiger mucosus DSM 16094 TaxID=1123237 RepID=S9S794_9RHOB|nr:hypothetical protein [Salipiger mucosus]EPX82069.1 hypothetical protein Salmuc_02436 [Salipiger mucosus DSM 16094]
MTDADMKTEIQSQLRAATPATRSGALRMSDTNATPDEILRRHGGDTGDRMTEAEMAEDRAIYRGLPSRLPAFFGGCVTGALAVGLSTLIF